MREQPILFSGPMVRAILEGRKTQTRRVIKPQPVIGDGGCWFPEPPQKPTDRSRHYASERHMRKGLPEIFCPYGIPGFRLWVRETFAIESNFNIESNQEYPPSFTDGRPVKHTPDDGDWSAYWQQPHYRATDPEPEFSYENDNSRKSCKACEEGDPHVHWKPSIHMPRWASRLTLEVKAVRVERLQEISEEDARAEGVDPFDGCTPEQRVPGPGFDGLSEADGLYRIPFFVLWESINAKSGHGWETNPWVWVIEFERVAA